MHRGERVVLLNPVDRYPHFVAPAGSVGLITHMDDDHISVRLDSTLPGAEEWDNEVHWYDPDEFRADVEREHAGIRRVVGFLSLGVATFGAVAGVTSGFQLTLVVVFVFGLAGAVMTWEDFDL